MNEIKIHTISDFQRYVQLYGLPKLSICGLGRIYEHGLVDLPRKPTPSIKYHRKAKNTYLLRYGERWVEKLKLSSSMSKFCCITDMIWFMMKEAEKLMKGSVREDNFFIVHDALVLITAKETFKGMNENNYSHRWLLPMNGLQDGTPYDGRPVVNIPEFMPLDNSLNRDILHSLRIHCVLSRFFMDREGTDEEERNMYFSFSTTEEIARGLKRIWESKMGTPSLERIIQDVDMALKVLEIIHCKNRAAVEGLDDRNGHRRKLVGEMKSVSWVGARTKGKGCDLTKRCSCTVIC